MKSGKQRIRRISLALLLCVLIAGSVRLPQAAAAGPDALAAANNQIWQQGTNLQGGAESYQNPNNIYYSQGDALGSAVATGDFNGDGYADLAVGVPGEDAQNTASGENPDGKGAVAVIYGTATGLQQSAGPGNQLFQEGDDGLVGKRQKNEQFGAALAAADFNNDGYDDLAVGIPGNTKSFYIVDVYSEPVGGVAIIYGSAGGLTAGGGATQVPSNHQLRQGSPLNGGPEIDDRVGAALAAGDFNGDGFADLAIGAPGEDSGAGAVNIIYGGASGLSANTAVAPQIWQQNTPGIRGGQESQDEFGAALAAGDFNKDGYTDLAIGVPGEGCSGEVGAGSVAILYGSASGLGAWTGPGNQLWDQDGEENPSQFDLLGSAGKHDHFGKSLAAGDFNGDGFCDLAVGSPDAGPNAGSVAIIYGSGTGLVKTNNQFIGPYITPAHYDNFGAALTAGYFNADDIMDLAVGVPAREEDSSVLKGGAVHIYHGQSTGFITTTPDQTWTQGNDAILGAAEKEDCMGAALAAADFDNNGFTDLAIGSPGEDEDAGAVRVLYGMGNHTPFANPGGPYNATNCSSITLDGSASSDKNQPADTLTFEWDLDGDGVFGETGANAARGNEIGAHPVFLTTNPGAATYFPIYLKVTDNGALSSTNMGAVLLDNEFPVFTPPANISVPATPTLCKAMVNIVAPTPAASCITVTITGVRNDGLPLWEYYPTGNTIITWTATNPVGMSTVHHQTIRVYDDAPPVFSYLPADIAVATTPNQATATVTPGFPVASDFCSLGVTITGERSDGQSLYSPYPIGVTGITWKAKDAADNTAYGVQKITVTDNEPPALVCPANLNAPSEAGMTYAHLSPGSPTATDNASNLTLTATRSDNMALTDLYPAGATSIAWRAVDANGNQSTCVQTVRVKTQADVSVAIASSVSLAQVGQEFSLVLTVANTGPSPALGVTASATLPAGMAFLSANPSAGSCSYDPAQRKLECTMGVLSQNSSRPVEVIVRGIEPLTGSILAAAGANTATTSDVQPANNTAAVTVTVRQ